MTTYRGRSASPFKRNRPEQSGLAYTDSSQNESFLDTRQIEAFGRTAYTTASQLIAYNPNDPASHQHYRNALSTMHKSLRRPALQRSVFSFAKANPTQILRSIGKSEIEARAIAYVPDELLRDAPESSSPFSLLEGFKASLPESDDDLSVEGAKRRPKRGRGRKMIEDIKQGPAPLSKMRGAKAKLDHKLEMMGVRKNMCASEIREIDGKLANLSTMRKIVLDRLATLEQEEHDLEQEIADLVDNMDDVEERLDREKALDQSSPSPKTVDDEPKVEDAEEEAGFMSESIYAKLPEQVPKSKRRKANRRISMPILHEHLSPGSRIREVQAHNDIITALDFDGPFGTMVTAAMDDTVRVWDLNAGRCIGLLEGHLSSVRCLQVEDNIVATGSMDASIRLWDLSLAEYDPFTSPKVSAESAHDPDGAEAGSEALLTPTSADDAEHNTCPRPDEFKGASNMENCALFTLQAHVDEITALHFQGNTLVSGSADKTLRQWDLEKGRCVQTLDVLWAAAQASTINPSAHGGSTSPASPSESGWWKPTAGRVINAEADFVGALQVFDAALAAGTADGVVRLWDLRSGMVHRSLVGHTGPVTSLQFDDTFLVTGSRDRSIRIWDLRTGGIYDAFAYDKPITAMQFDTRRIVAAAGENVVKVYDKTDGRQWDCGPGVLDEDGGILPTAVERVKIKDGYLIEGRRNGMVGAWSC